MDFSIIGRKTEIELLERQFQANQSSFIAVYGRRRVGKTFLIRSVFEDKMSFQLTGLSIAKTQKQLANFHAAMQRSFPDAIIPTSSMDWFSAFQHLISALEKSNHSKKVIFLDELPWMDTPKSDFIIALEHFWNSWASARRDVMLIVCGSAASWMINNLINNHGGLHNRVTHRIKLEAFRLSECEAFLKSRTINFDRYQLTQLYMVMGGIPYYLEQINKSLSVTQNIDNLCFTPNGLLRNEFSNLYASLFKKADKHIEVVRALAQKGKGLSRNELLAATQLANAGSTTKILQELEESGFIRIYHTFGKKKRDTIYQLCDFYSLFYLKFIENSSDLDQNIWLNSLDSPAYRSWSGYAFEQVGMAHLDQIKKALGIAGVQTHSSAWLSSDKNAKAQIDLLIDRRDHVINLCEMKFSLHPFIIDKKYAQELQQKIAVFKQQTQSNKAIFLTFITTFGLQANEYANLLVQNSLKLEELFD